ncbi:hypothetical protein E7T09_12945 [Deinococcus sp. KSM4-11]|uniref:TubC N-terminal docking domain-related protein n=1 Tax=Deinococcus sp. KSM4-11 TaxID=2568654 RepID=UPI0010A2BE31|nr:hypothetical protein [Deinococcus sp. KSM4-11]THF86131.1 hypothetical protein E7T09_12945 [Deinococcus sp. KSM4-11]
MGVTELLRELEGRGVRLAVEGSRLVARAPQGAVTPELAEQIKMQKAALMAAIQATGGQHLPPLPEALARLVHAAVGNHLNYPASIAGGMVGNLGDYVLASAALYAVGSDPERHIQALWAARGAWAA